MDILMLSDVYFPRVNGVSTSIRTYCEALVAQGHRVTLVAPDYGVDGQARQDAREPFEILRLASRKIFFDPEDRLPKSSAVRATLHALKDRPWDVIHIHTPFRAHSLGVKLAKLTGIPTVETYHTYFELYIALYLPWLPGGLLRALSRRLSRRLCGEVDHLIVPSAQMAAVLAGYGIDTAHTVLPTGIALEEFRGGNGNAFRIRNQIALDRPTLVTVSRLAREKNIDFLLQVVARVVAVHPTLLFIVAGEGPDSERLRALAVQLGIADNVRFFGNLDRRTALLDCYRAGGLFVFASPTETQGLVLAEAMACGVPIVSTAVMGTATVLAESRSARISGEDAEEFAGHVSALLSDPDERARLASHSAADAARWSADGLMTRVAVLYEALAARAQSRPGGALAVRAVEEG